MKKIALVLALLSSIASADLVSGFPASPAPAASAYAGKVFVNMSVASWFVKAGTNDIIVNLSEYPAGIVIPETDKVTQTAFLMAAQSKSKITFYCASGVSDTWFNGGVKLTVNNFSANF